MNNFDVLLGMKLGGGGGSSTLVSKTITANGTYNPSDDNADGYSVVVANVPNTYTLSDEGKVVDSGALVGQTAKNIDANGLYDTTLNNSVSVDVPNSYTAGDEGKVVSQGDLVSQSAYPSTVTQNGTYDTTLNNSVTVDVTATESLLKSYIEGDMTVIPNSVSEGLLYSRKYTFGNNRTKTLIVNHRLAEKYSVNSFYKLVLNSAAGTFSGNTTGLSGITNLFELELGSTATVSGVNAYSSTPLCHLIANTSSVGGAVQSSSPYSCFQTTPLTELDFNANSITTASFASSYLMRASLDCVNIGLYAFWNNYSLHELSFTDRLTSIGNYAFGNCTGLATVSLPESVTTISANTFSGCINLTTITIDKPQDSIAGAPWGAPNATVVWTG